MSRASEQEHPTAGSAGPDTGLGQAWYRDKSVAEIHAEEVGTRRERMGAWRALRPVLAVLLLLVVLDVVLRLAVPPTSLVLKMPDGLGSYYVKLAEFEAVDPPDVLILGSSRVARGVDPAIVEDELGRRLGRPVMAFNLGLNNAKLEELTSVVHSHLATPTPPFVVLGFSGTELVRDFEFQYASRFLWSAGDCLAYLRRTDPARIEWRHVELYLQQLLGRTWYLFDQRGALKAEILWRLREGLGLVGEAELAIATRKERQAADLLASRHGYWRDTEFEGADLGQRLDADPAAVRIPGRELRHPLEILRGTGFPMLAALVQELVRRGSRVALVEVPPSPFLAERNPVMHGDGLPPSAQHPEGLPGIRTRLAELAAELGVLYLPLGAREIGLTNGDYVDANHMSAEGAARYTRLLVGRLEERGYFERAP